MLKLATLILISGFVQQVLVAPTIDHVILKQLREEQTTNVILTMKDDTISILNNLKTLNFATRSDRLNAVANTLRAFATASQKNVLKLLDKERESKPFSVTTLWITNQIILREADSDLLDKLVVFNEIAGISEEKFIKLDDPIDQIVYDNLEATDEDEVQWGVKQIQAPIVWNEGNTGKNIIIGTVDTGARGTHEALRDNYVGEYGWYDPSEKTKLPNDQQGHGTHTTANIVGRARNIGVAPGSKWMACKGCASVLCSQFHLLECGQWMACPTKPDFTEPDCSKAPHVVSNSWGGGSGSWYNGVIEAYHASQIIPVFSVGNSGPRCGSAISPGDYDNVIGVGSTTMDNFLSNFSSVGPTVNGKIKPDIAAPGSEVFSAYMTSDTAYSSMSGTSMACPHAAGVVALLLSANPGMTYDQVKDALTAGSVQTNPTGLNCGDIPETQYPNHHVGHGRINALRSIHFMSSLVDK